MTWNVFFYSLLFLFSVNSLQAHESRAGRFVGTFGPFIYKTDTEQDINQAESPTLGGFSAHVEGGVDKNGGIEVGLSYLHKIYIRRSNNNVISEKLKRLQMNIGYRHWFTTYFSTALHYYTSYSMGDPTIIHNDFTSSPVYTSAHRTAENGFEFSALFEIYQAVNYTIVSDLRYAYSTTARDGEEANIMGIILGYKIEIEAK